jgi:hypothetical protein
MRYTEKTVTVDYGVAGIDRVTLNVSGVFVRCVGSSYDFYLSLDEGPEITFGVGRAITPKDDAGFPKSFSRLAVRWKMPTPTVSDSNPITLIIGSLDFQDDRLALYPNQQVRTQSHRSMRSNGPVTVTTTPGVGGIANGGLDAIHVRNLDSTNPVYLSTSISDLQSNPTWGLLLEAGENIDLPVSTRGGIMVYAVAVGGSVQLQVTGYKHNSNAGE